MAKTIMFGGYQGSTGLLAEQEMRVLLAICTGLTGKETALELGRAPGTLKKTLERVFFKLRVRNRAALVAEAFRLGLIVFSNSMMPAPKHQQDQDQHQGVLVA